MNLLVISRCIVIFLGVSGLYSLIFRGYPDKKYILGVILGNATKFQRCTHQLASTVEKRLKKICKLIPLCIIWRFCQERNTRYFEGGKEHNSVIKNRCLQYLFCWHKTDPLVSTNEFFNSLDSGFELSLEV